MSRQLLSDSLGVARVELAIEIAASRAVVWDALIEQPTEWWQPGFYVSPKPLGIIIEPRVGGRWYEDAGDGSGGLWGIIQTILPPHTLEVRGDLFPEWGGPAIMHLRITLEETAANMTTLHVVDTCFGRVSDAFAASLEGGWRVLFGDGLKPFVERRQ